MRNRIQTGLSMMCFFYTCCHGSMHSSSAIKSLTSEATPSATPFFKRAYKLAILPDYKCPGLICLALPARQKFGLILVIKLLLVEVKKNHLNKKCAPNLLFFNEKQNQKDSDDF